MGGHRVGRAARVEQWRQRYWRRARTAETDVDRLAAAADHLRLALKYAGPQQRRRLAEQHTSALVASAEDVLTAYETGRSTR